MPAMMLHSGRYTAGRYLQALAIGKGMASNAAAFAEEQGQWIDRAKLSARSKAAVTPIETGDFPPR